jgi:hypothetical protein
VGNSNGLFDYFRLSLGCRNVVQLFSSFPVPSEMWATLTNYSTISDGHLAIGNVILLFIISDGIVFTVENLSNIDGLFDYF